MTGPRSTASTTRGVELLERAVNYTLGCVQDAAGVPLSTPTPCESWDLRALIAHMSDSLLALHEAIDVGTVELQPVLPDPADPLRTLRDLGCRLLGAWTNGDGRRPISVAGCPITTSMVTTTGAIEVAVHGWDVAQACGADRPVPPALALELLRLAPQLVTDDDRPGRFAPPIEVPRAARPSDRLVAFLGRQP